MYNQPKLYLAATGRIAPWLVSTLAALSACGTLAALGEDAKKPEATAAPAAAKDLMDMDLDSLANVKVTSVSKKAEKATDAPAAIFVVTQDDIHRVGAQRITDALRLVPGLEVGQVDSATFAVGSRGHNGEFADKLLVLVDGRSVYSPVFSGVYWEQLGMVMDDVDRIEVIRGPGATVWGANAVNGVINIMTKSAKETQGGIATVGTGTETKVDAAARYGEKVSESTYGRVYATYEDHYDLKLKDAKPGYGYNGEDGWDIVHGGFRIDSEVDKDATLTFSGDVFGGHERVFADVATGTRATGSNADYANGTVNENDHLFGANFLGKFERKLSDTSEYSVQAYFDRSERQYLGYGQTVNTYDAEAQYSFALGERNSFVSGVGYRLYDVNFSNDQIISINPAQANYQLFSAFIQDEIELAKDKLKLTLGSKLEHNDLSGFEVQPSARLAFKATETQTIWGAISRAVRTPSLIDNGFSLSLQNLPGTPPGVYQYRYPGSLNSEQLVAYELGYRIQPTKKLLLDVAGFYNVYDGLAGVGAAPTVFVPTPYFHYITGPSQFNALNEETYGTELSATYQVLETWRVHANYTFTKVQAHNRTANIVDESSDEASAPEQQFSLRNSVDLPHDIQLDGTLRYVDTWASGGSKVPQLRDG